MAEVPTGVVTVTSTAPVPAGLLAVIVVSLTTATFVAAVDPKSTVVAPVKLVPVIVTIVPPDSRPCVGLRLVTAGALGTVYVNSSAGVTADVPWGAVTVTFTTPMPAGLSAMIVVSLTTSRLVAAVDPKSTAVAPVKLAPVIVTNVPPTSGPLVGLRPVTVGGDSTIRRSTHSNPGRRARDRFALSFRPKANDRRTMVLASKTLMSRPTERFGDV